ncbi:rCG20017, isoform CRA_b [Rattus norvegicus]|uniref:RCG20017, isoform CRA_b n=1 Tax=Rattus norvegicus TaxID=10116 RepID=A6KIG8_RAT|nr:rCG20017, isoform CRA_b [Rattus norvegicus]
MWVPPPRSPSLDPAVCRSFLLRQPTFPGSNSKNVTSPFPLIPSLAAGPNLILLASILWAFFL